MIGEIDPLMRGNFELALDLRWDADGADVPVISGVGIGCGEREVALTFDARPFQSMALAELDAVAGVAGGEANGGDELGTFELARDFERQRGPGRSPTMRTARRAADVGARRGVHLVPIHVPGGPLLGRVVA